MMAVSAPLVVAVRTDRPDADVVTWAVREAVRRGARLVVAALPAAGARGLGFRRAVAEALAGAVDLAHQQEPGLDVRVDRSGAAGYRHLLALTESADLLVLGTDVEPPGPGPAASLPERLAVHAGCPVVVLSPQALVSWCRNGVTLGGVQVRASHGRRERDTGRISIEENAARCVPGGREAPQDFGTAALAACRPRPLPLGGVQERASQDGRGSDTGHISTEEDAASCLPDRETGRDAADTPPRGAPEDHRVVAGWAQGRSGRHALVLGAAEAAARGAWLTVVSVPPRDDPLVDRTLGRPDHDSDLLAAVADVERAHAGLVVDLLHRKGSVPAALARAAERAELLVIGCHHSDQPWTDRPGAVADTLMRSAPCPLMLVGVATPRHQHGHAVEVAACRGASSAAAESGRRAPARA